MTGKTRRSGAPAATPADGAPATANTPREQPYLVTRQDVLLPAGFAPVNLDDVLDQLADDPAVHVERVIEPTGLALLASTPGPLQRVVVARMPGATARELGEQHPQLLVEPDALLRPLSAPAPPLPDLGDPGAFSPFGLDTSWSVRVTGPDGSPAVGAAVFLYGAGIPVQGRTDADGRVELSLPNESDDSLRALYVNPQSTYWSLWIDEPRLRSGQPNTVHLTPLSATHPGFPAGQLLGWGQRTMRLDQLDPTLTGAGVTVAVIDSGAATGHPDLARIKTGRDFTVSPANDVGWTEDTIAHGSHCCGVIAAGDDAAGIRGFAPDAEVRGLRIFPGGRFSSLIDAIGYCIEQEVDVVNMSLGSGSTAEAMLQKLAQARQSGVACIVAAGNSGGPVQFPGTSPDVLTVAAVGKLGEYPDDSFHARQVPAAGPVDNGYFSATFSCHGPEVDVCAPGVAVISSVPPDGFAAWDGTSMAAPHVSGLAALVLAHHPDFVDRFRRRDAARVDRLFAILRASATPLNLGDTGRTGAGVPDVVRALAVRIPEPGAAGGPSSGSAIPGSAIPGGAIPDGVVTAILGQLRADFVAAGLG
jgi:subtilisin family serine protease